MLPKLLQTAVQKDLLVVGCGTGNEIEKFRHDKYTWSVTGVDPSIEMLTQARKKLETFNRLELIEGFVSDVPIRQFGAATLLLVLHFLKDDGEKLHILQEIAMRLEPGAPFIILDITGDDEQIERNLEILRLILPNGLDEKQIQVRISRIQNELQHVSEQRLSELLQEAGFEPPLRFFQSSIYMGWLTKKI